MKQITANEFYAMIIENPSVFKHWETPLEITEFVDCRESNITHLSSKLTFSGKNKNGECADFSHCHTLKIATGKFHTGVLFTNSNIEKIENLEVSGVDKYGASAYFYSCPNLKIATGTYEGAADFEETGIESIQNLHVKNPDKNGMYAYFAGCENLHTLESWDITKKTNIEIEKFSAEKTRLKRLKEFIKRNQPDTLPFL
jgi:hypothetical protein